MPIKINGATSGSTTITAPNTGSDETIELSTALAAKANLASPTFTGTVDMSAATVKGTGLDLVASQAFTTATSVIVNNCFTAAASDYCVVIDIDAGTTDANVNLRFRASGSDAAALYYFGAVGVQNNATSYVTNGDNVAQITVAEIDTANASVGAGLTIEVYSPQRAQVSKVAWSGVYSRSSNSTIISIQGGGVLYNSNAYDGFSLLVSAGTITGNVRVYARRNS